MDPDGRGRRDRVAVHPRGTTTGTTGACGVGEEGEERPGGERTNKERIGREGEAARGGQEGYCRKG